MSLDLNLLLSLDALLQERNVTRAAQKLGLSQPTVSAALSRLRRHFGDELLARTGNQYVLTPLAERLVEQTAQALSWTNRVFENRTRFEPESATREFTVIASDAQLPVFGRVLTELVQAEAPNVRIRFLHSTPVMVLQAQDHLRNVDALVLPQGIMAGFPSVDLYRDRWACVVSTEDGRPVSLTIEDLRRRPWVLPYASPMPVLSVLHRLRAAGVEPRAVMTSENFLAIPHLVRDTDRIGLVPERVARLSQAPNLVTAQIPFGLGILVESLWWHPMNDLDPGHVWFREAASRAAATITDPD